MKGGSLSRRKVTSTVFKVIVGVVVIGGLALVLVWSGAWGWLWELFSDREKIQQMVDGAGPLAPAVYVALLFLQAVVAPLPAPAVAIGGGFAFGVFEGFILTWLGALLGGAACFGISRAFGRRFVLRSEGIMKFDPYIKKHGALMVFVLRLVPLISFDAISYAAGLSGIPFWKFLLATALGMAPGTFLFVYLGGASLSLVTYAILGVLAALSVVVYVYLRRRFRPSGGRNLREVK